MEEDKKRVLPTPIDQWKKINKILWIHKLAIFVLGSVSVLLTALTFYLVNRSEIVIGLTNTERLLFVGERKASELTEKDVSQFSKSYLKARYTWKNYDVRDLLKTLAPLSSEGLLEKLKVALNKNQKVIKKQKLSQDAIIRWVRLEKGLVRARVDQVIHMNSALSVVSPIEVKLHIMKGRANRFNPLGLFVNQIMETRKGTN